MSYSPIDLSQLPSPDVVEMVDFEQLLEQRKAYLLSLYPAEQQEELAVRLALESEPLNKLLQELTYREVLLRQRVNDATRSTMLAYASGNDLENLGALLGVSRLIVTPGNPGAVPPIATVYEADSRYRQRIQLALEGFSTAGPVGAYTFHSLSASPQVKDVAITSTVPGVVSVTVLSTSGNGEPDAPLLATVLAALNDEDVRPLCDTVEVLPATLVNYQVEAVLTFYAGPDMNLVKTAAIAAVNQYVSEHHRLGYDVTRSGLFAALHQPGVQNVQLINPAADIVIESTEAAYCTSVTVTGDTSDV